ncbi:hypothetical protein [Halobacillus massiliensis]|uniref:hypothetical protein n=1 Tax=Halobacillus massiliensis TaxID=1926286 RepID=UPI0009E4755B|nr:hypothetical protein [Halobacillus massiliensis]
MKMNPRFKMIWWGCLLINSLILLIFRFDSLASDNAQPFDYLIFALFIVLAFQPFFAEMSLFGLSFKKELEEQIETGLNEIKLLINNTNSNNLYFSNELSDEHLRKLKESIVSSPKTMKAKTVNNINKEIASLLEIRYLLEKELKRIASSTLNLETANIPISEMADLLLQKRLIGSEVNRGMKVMEGITNKVALAEKVSKSEIDFCLSAGPATLQLLQEI